MRFVMDTLKFYLYTYMYDMYKHMIYNIMSRLKMIMVFEYHTKKVIITNKYYK